MRWNIKELTFFNENNLILKYYNGNFRFYESSVYLRLRRIEVRKHNFNPMVLTQKMAHNKVMARNLLYYLGFSKYCSPCDIQNELIILKFYPTLRTCFDIFWYFYDKPASRKDSHRVGEIWSCELRFYFPLVFFLVHLKLLTQCRDHAGLRNKY